MQLICIILLLNGSTIIECSNKAIHNLYLIEILLHVSNMNLQTLLFRISDKLNFNLLQSYSKHYLITYMFIAKALISLYLLIQTKLFSYVN